MSHTPRSKYVGNHGGAYTDIHGHRKVFTTIDHDKHSTRLKNWSYDRKQFVKTDLQMLIDSIMQSCTNEKEEFITLYDTVLANKFGFERLRQGTPITYEQLDKSYDGWFEDLKQLYEGRFDKKNRKNPGLTVS